MPALRGLRAAGGNCTLVGKCCGGQSLAVRDKGGNAMGRLADKTIIVTGAGSGIGRAACLLFSAEGARVIGADREDSVQQTAAMVAEAGGQMLAAQIDAGREEDVAGLVALAQSSFGRLDGFWANAGISGGLVPLFDQTVEQWQEVLRVNLIGPFLAVKHAAPVMIAQGGGAIVCTASVAALRAGASAHAYAASKAGVVSLVQTTAYSLTGTGVRINAVCPGLIETGMTRPIFERAEARGTRGKIGQLNPLQRAGQPREIAAMAGFLLSDDASYVNGQAVAVDGGLSASLPYAGKPA